MRQVYCLTLNGDDANRLYYLKRSAVDVGRNSGRKLLDNVRGVSKKRCNLSRSTIKLARVSGLFL
jgi:hypothetical protein